MKPLTRSLSKFIEKVFSKRYSLAFAKIFSNWQAIVGENLAKVCVPIMLDKFDRILVVQIYDQSKSIELHFMQEIVVERINLLLQSKNISQQISKLHIKNRLS
jgi:hypothetical protein